MRPTFGKSVLAAIVVLLTASCTSGDQRGEGAADPDAASLRGGTLRVGIPDALAGGLVLDPQRAYSAPPWELFRCCLLRTLYAYNGRPTEEGGAEPRPDLAAGPPSVSADGLTWTFRLREGLTYAPPFGDTAITAPDVVRALERTARVGGYRFLYTAISGFKAYRSGAADSIVGLETPDDRTLVVRLDDVTGDLLYRFAEAATAPMPEGSYDDLDQDMTGAIVASGPYMIEGSEELEFAQPTDIQAAAGYVPPVLGEKGAVQDPGSLVLVRNPSWEPHTDPLRAADPDRIEVTLSDLDNEAIAERVDRGQLDLVFASSSPIEQVARYRGDPALKDRVFIHPNDAQWAVTMNLAVPPFDDVHVRRAVSLAIDRAALVEMVSEPPYGPFGFSFGEVATHMAPDAFDGGLLRAFDPLAYDPEAARDEMRASAYDRTGDGRCDATACRDVRVLVMDAGVLVEQARAVRDDLAGIGIDLTLDAVSPGGFFGDPQLGGRRVGSIHDPGAHNPMGIAYPWGQDYPDGGGWYLGLVTRSGIPGSNTSLVGALPGELRRWGYSVTSVPSVEEAIRACLERRGVSRIQCWAELDQHLSTEVVSRVPYMVTEHAQVVSERVVAYSFDQFAGLPALDRVALAPGSE